MIKVLCKNKVGNRIESYTCTDGRNVADLSKEKLAEYIDKKQVENAAKQIYNGRVIIRLKEDVPERIANKNVEQQFNKPINTQNKPITQNKPTNNQNTEVIVDRKAIERIHSERSRLMFYRVPDLYDIIHNTDDRVIKLAEDLYAFIDDAKDDIIIASNKFMKIPDKPQLHRGLFANTAFSYISLGNLKTFDTVSMEYMFSNCKLRDDLDLDIATSSVRTMSHMFENSVIPYINLRRIDTCKVEYMNSMFKGCRTRAVRFDNQHTGRVVDVSSMFEGCCMSIVDLNHFNFKNVRSMKNMFKGAYIEDLTFGDWYTCNVETVSGMFENAEIDTIDIRGLNTKSIVDASNMFKGCKAKKIVMGDLRFRPDANLSDILSNCNAQIIPECRRKELQTLSGSSIEREKKARAKADDKELNKNVLTRFMRDKRTG